MNNSALIVGIAVPVAVVLLIAAGWRLIARLLGMVIVPDDKIGILEKKFALGPNARLPDGAVVALNGEAGLQADTLAPGLHLWLFPWQWSVTLVGFTKIDQGKIGLIEASGGGSIQPGRILGTPVSCDSFQSVRAFLAGGGQRGPQISIIPPGSYRINTLFFKVYTSDVTEIKNDTIGIVTTKDGTPLAEGEIAGEVIPGHNTFQDAGAFVAARGKRGLQEQVLMAGKYYINPFFATIELAPMTMVPIAHAGVVISFVGKEGKDVTGVEFKHANMVERGCKGVWVDPLDPGKYPINPKTQRLEVVPTANVVLNWATGKTESHKLDEKLCTITVRSKDGFTFNLDVSQIIHIPRNDAPKVIARFGSVENLVSQVLEPTIGNYFRNSAQSSDVIDFLTNRQARQKEARDSIAAALADYNVGAVDTLIGDIVPPDALMRTLTDRKIAEQQRVTYATQEQAAAARQKFEQATAMAATQATVVNSERQVAISEFQAKASIASAEGQAKAKTIQAAADANVVEIVGKAEATKVQAIGTAEADVIKLKIESMESGNYAAVQIAEALAGAKVPIVPEIQISGQMGGKQSGLVDVLLGNLVREQLKSKSTQPSNP